MRRKAGILLLLCLVSLAPFGYARSAHSSGRGHSSKSHKSKKSKESKSDGTVHVKAYNRKDGSHVAAYDRRAPSSNGAAQTANATYRSNFVAPGHTADKSVRLDEHGKIKRSKAAKDAFEREQPCPSTGKSSGSCRGYVVDHKIPLECGGPDSSSNMQWQTTADAKQKDKTERSCRL